MIPGDVAQQAGDHIQKIKTWLERNLPLPIQDRKPILVLTRSQVMPTTDFQNHLGSFTPVDPVAKLLFEYMQRANLEPGIVRAENCFHLIAACEDFPS